MRANSDVDIDSRFPSTAAAAQASVEFKEDRAKRVFDIVVSLLGTLIASPIFLGIAMLVKLDSPGPVFFRQRRAGQLGKEFKIFKFRTMVDGAYLMGSRLTVKRDPRITRLGRILRWSKLDELPQLFNVLLGDMSLIGPRPEDPFFVKRYTDEQRRALSVRPGVVGPSQIYARDEVEDYPEGIKDTEAYYLEHILPEKLTRDVAYVEEASFRGDVVLLIKGLWTTVRGTLKAKYFWERRRRLALMAIDLVLVAVAYMAALMIRLDGDLPELGYTLQTLVVILLVRPPLLAYFGSYQGIISYFGLWDMMSIFKAVSVGSLVVAGVTYLVGFQSHPRSVFFMDWAILLFLLCSSRYLLRAWVRKHPRHVREARENVIVVGAGLGGEQIGRALLDDPVSSFNPIGFIDESIERWGSRIHGIKVLGGPDELKLALSANGVQAVFVCLSDLREGTAEEVADICAGASVECRVVPALSELLKTNGFSNGSTAQGLSPAG